MEAIWITDFHAYVDRLEAAYEREAVVSKMETTTKESLGVESTCKEPLSVESVTTCNGLQNSCKQTLQGNNAKTRDLLAQARTLLKVCTWDEDINQAGVDSLLAEIDAVLSAPLRNCDKFANLHDAWIAWQSYCAEHFGKETMKFHVWLYANEKGENDGNK